MRETKIFNSKGLILSKITLLILGLSFLWLISLGTSILFIYLNANTISSSSIINLEGGNPPDDLGYNQKDLTVGRNASSYLNADPYITNKSIITLNYSYYNSDSVQLPNHTHNLMSNILLPLGTTITLIDHIKDKVYKLKILTADDIYNYNNSCNGEGPECVKIATYPFTLFKEIGTGTTNKYFVEFDYYNNGVIDEKFTIILDFANTNFTTNYSDVALFLELHDTGGIVVRETLEDTIKEFNIYSTVSSASTNAVLYLNTSYSGTPITFNSDSSTNININAGLTYKYTNDFKIIDTTFEDKEIGLSVKVVDAFGESIDRAYLEKMIFKMNGTVYYPEADDIIRINLQNGISNFSDNLTIQTFENNAMLDKGTYYFKINSYVAYGGVYYDELSSAEISIPLTVSHSNYDEPYSFDVIMDDEHRILDKIEEEVKVPFNILLNSTLANPNIKISLYKKDQLTADNQDYSIVNLDDYVTEELSIYENNIYYVTNNPIQYGSPNYDYNYFELNLITDNFEHNGYKLEFYLYDDNEKIGTIKRHFIVKGEKEENEI